MVWRKRGNFFFFGERACWAVDAFGTCIGIFFLLLLRLRVFNFVFYIFFGNLRQICLKQNNILYLCCGSYFF